MDKVCLIFLSYLVLQSIVILLSKLLECGHQIYILIEKDIHAYTPLYSRHTNLNMLFQET